MVQTRPRRWLLPALLVLLAGLPAWSQKTTPAPASKPAGRYANMPAVAVPFGHFVRPYHKWYLSRDTLRVDDGASLKSATGKLAAVNIGFLGPISFTSRESWFGQAMLHGAQMAIDEANARGGYRAPGAAHGIPYVLKIHNDQNLWGASSNQVTDMFFRQHVWGMLGSIDGSSTHVALRVALKLDLPIVNTATADASLTETRIPWLLRDFPDARQQGYALSRYIFQKEGIQRVVVLREIEWYGRQGVVVFDNVARRLGHPPLLELTFHRGETDFSRQIAILKQSPAQALLVWGLPADAGRLLQQLRKSGISLPVFGPSMLNSRQFLKMAGAAANGMVVTSALDPDRTSPAWLTFRNDYEQRYHQPPDAFAARAYDGMNILLGAVQKGGLNHGRIMKALLQWQMKTYHGVAGASLFDHTLNDVSPLTMARIEDGRFLYFAAPGTQAEARVQKPIPHPYASMQAATVAYHGPGRSAAWDVPSGPLTFGLFVPLHGPGQRIGEALLAGARLAIARANQSRRPGQRRFALAVGDSSQSWGLLSSRIVSTIFQNHALALIAPDGNSAHLSEQVANKIGLPVVTLSGDPTTTQINLPWIFRFTPGDDAQALQMAQRLRQPGRPLRVALIAGTGHDGREGQQAFLAAARSAGLPAPRLFALPAPGQGAAMMAALNAFHPQAVVVWTNAAAARRFLLHWRAAQRASQAPVLLSWQAAGLLPWQAATRAGNHLWTAGMALPSPSGSAPSGAWRSAFTTAWRQAHSSAPPRLAAAAFDAVALLIHAAEASGPNRVRLRDRLAVWPAAGTPSHTAFDGAGNSLARVALRHIPTVSAAVPVQLSRRPAASPARRLLSQDRPTRRD